MKYLRVSLTLCGLLLFINSGHAREYKHLQFNSSLKKSESMVNILDQLYELLSESYDEIGEAEVERIMNERDLGQGVLNYGGFSWYKPMINFEVAARRQIAPELHSERWIIHDSLIIFIDAASLLTNLRSEGVIEITDEALALFIGLTFTRKYHYYHFASTYKKALVSDFSKLFLSFTRFDTDSIFQVKNEELLKREDKFEVSAKLAGNIPITTGLTLGMATSAKLAYQSTISYQHVKDSEQDEMYRISQESLKESELQSHLSVKLDFLGIIQETLLNHEIQYKLTKTTKSYLGLTKTQVEEILQDPVKKNEIKDFLKGSPEIEKLQEYQVSYEQRKKENFESKFGFLLLGKIRKKSLEQVKIIKNNTEKIFFKSYYESTSFIQSLFSRLFSGVINRFFKIGKKASNTIEISKKISFEYEKYKDLNHKTKNAETLSIHISQSFEASSLRKRKRRKKAINHLKLLTSLDDEFVKKISDKKLNAPMRIVASLEVGTVGIKYFNTLEYNKILPIFFNICKLPQSRQQKLMNRLIAKKRIHRSKNRKLNRSLKCVKKVSKYYFRYIEDLKKTKSINIKLLKKFLEYTFKKTKNYQQLSPIFGTDNTFIHGELVAMTDKKLSFRTYFKSGKFREFGVIDRFKLK